MSLKGSFRTSVGLLILLLGISYPAIDSSAGSIDQQEVGSPRVPAAEQTRWQEFDPAGAGCPICQDYRVQVDFYADKQLPATLVKITFVLMRDQKVYIDHLTAEGLEPSCQGTYRAYRKLMPTSGEPEDPFEGSTKLKLIVNCEESSILLGRQNEMELTADFEMAPEIVHRISVQVKSGAKRKAQTMFSIESATPIRTR